MDFVEERTPAGYLIKIFLNSKRFIVFDEKGNSIDIYGNSEKLIYNILLIVFVGRSFKIKPNFSKSYTLLKARDEQLILPYSEWIGQKTKYAFLPTNIHIDMVPANILLMPNISAMIRDIDFKDALDYVLVDNGVSESDMDIIKGRFHSNRIINIGALKNEASSKDGGKFFDNINVLSDNPEFLTIEHLRTGDTVKLRQIILDMELTVKDLERMLRYVDMYIKNENFDEQTLGRLKELHAVLSFYYNIAACNEEQALSEIDNEKRDNILMAFKAIVMKVNVMDYKNIPKEFLSKCDALIQDQIDAVRHAEEKV